MLTGAAFLFVSEAADGDRRSARLWLDAGRVPSHQRAYHRSRQAACPRQTQARRLCSVLQAEHSHSIVEAKDNNHGIGDGMQQALGYADMLHVPFVFSSNGEG
jgi:hypothetical protein